MLIIVEVYGSHEVGSLAYVARLSLGDGIDLHDLPLKLANVDRVRVRVPTPAEVETYCRFFSPPAVDADDASLDCTDGTIVLDDVTKRRDARASNDGRERIE